MDLKGKMYDVISIKNISLGLNDKDILKMAENEDRIIITLDSDFGHLLFHEGYKFTKGIIYIRLFPFGKEEIKEILVDLITGKIPLKGSLYLSP